MKTIGIYRSIHQYPIINHDADWQANQTWDFPINVVNSINCDNDYITLSVRVTHGFQHILNQSVVSMENIFDVDNDTVQLYSLTDKSISTISASNDGEN